jgi:ceramide glucosyltransferase
MSGHLLAMALFSATTVWVVLGTLVVARLRFAARRTHDTLPAVTVLKPLAGADADLEANLRSFFLQDHPRMQLVFGVEGRDDPAVAIVARLRAAFPRVDAALVFGAATGQNPKVANLRNMLAVQKYDLLLISDSNVRVPSDYVSDMVATKLERNAGLVTSMFVGVGEQSVGAALENVQLNGFVAAGAALPTLLHDASVVGKSMLLSHAEFETLGGFARVSDVLAEDFIIGKMYQHASRSVVIARVVPECFNGKITIARALSRQLRWSMLRMRLQPVTFLLEPLTSPVVALLLVAGLLRGSGPVALAEFALWASLLIVLRDSVQWVLLRGVRGLFIPLLLGPVRDLAMLGVWLATPFVKHISWRGHRVRVGTGTLLFQGR